MKRFAIIACHHSAFAPQKEAAAHPVTSGLMVRSVWMRFDSLQQVELLRTQNHGSMHRQWPAQPSGTRHGTLRPLSTLTGSYTWDDGAGSNTRVVKCFLDLGWGLVVPCVMYLRQRIKQQRLAIGLGHCLKPHPRVDRDANTLNDWLEMTPGGSRKMESPTHPQLHRVVRVQVIGC